MIDRYRPRVSGPWLDPIDPSVEVPRVAVASVREDSADRQPSPDIRARAVAARARQHVRLARRGVVDHKHLDGVSEWIAAHQHEHDAARLANPKVTLHEKARIRTGAVPRVPVPG